MLEGGALIVQIGSDVHGGRVLALDPATEQRWSDRPGPGYASPVARASTRAPDHHHDQRVGGRHQRRHRRVTVVDPFPDDWHENIVTPIWTGSP